MSDNFPSFAVGSDTSFDSAASVEEVTGKLRELVYAPIKARPLACDDLEVALGLRQQTCSAARVRELHRKQFIRDNGQRQRTRSGRGAVVWGPAP